MTVDLFGTPSFNGTTLPRKPELIERSDGSHFRYGCCSGITAWIDFAIARISSSRLDSHSRERVAQPSLPASGRSVDARNFFLMASNRLRSTCRS
jgi:hypothetical protein